MGKNFTFFAVSARKDNVQMLWLDNILTNAREIFADLEGAFILIVTPLLKVNNQS